MIPLHVKNNTLPHLNTSATDSSNSESLTDCRITNVLSLRNASSRLMIMSLMYSGRYTTSLLESTIFPVHFLRCEKYVTNFSNENGSGCHPSGKLRIVYINNIDPAKDLTKYFLISAYRLSSTCCQNVGDILEPSGLIIPLFRASGISLANVSITLLLGGSIKLIGGRYCCAWFVVDSPCFHNHIAS